ncbi:hypothetical protein M404DRAFT_1007603 [Pisolithus tinctorius Marx 270]|uniref:Uncharacterized protein n=1 Tax=Pisolithus tinctorius Marx 270 TaxID=870435 RepID=A0A0C3JCC6_PISTI|nr:hypothetical protein M404DRAFT_1008166 [Pisolithus tinctorius Marx 270]KIN95311.1 hypothetical protein M404DRAFT_1007603 [Pisolithus tinctorius Marx 270]
MRYTLWNTCCGGVFALEEQVISRRNHKLLRNMLHVPAYLGSTHICSRSRRSTSGRHVVIFGPPRLY